MKGSKPTSRNGQGGSSAPSPSRPQYHYFYGSTANSVADSLSLTVNTNDTSEQDSLLGEILVPTDNEDDGTLGSEQDLQHLLASNGQTRSVDWFSSGRSQEPKQNGALAGLGTACILLLLAAPIVAFLMILLPNDRDNIISHLIPIDSIAPVPFQRVHRADYGDPVEGFLEMDLFHPSLLAKASDPQTFVFPFPTGAFWTNLVVPSSDPIFSYPIVVYPYAYKWSKTSLAFSYPAAHRIEDPEAHRQISDAFVPELKFSVTEQIGQRFITKYDPLSVTLRYISTNDCKWETSLVQGSPYTTITYQNATPLFQALSTFKSLQCPGDEAEDFHDFEDDESDQDPASRKLYGVCEPDQQTKTSVTVRGVQFVFSSKEGASYILFASEPISLQFDLISKTTLKATAPFSGTLRVAYIPVHNSTDTSTFKSTGLRRLIYHAGVYPTGGQVSWDFHSSPMTASQSSTTDSSFSTDRHRRATVQFAYTTNSLTDTSLRPSSKTIELLMLALPHHAQVLPAHVQLPPTKFDLTYDCIKGHLTPVVGSVWQYDEPLLTDAVDLEKDVPTTLDPGVRQVILKQVEADMLTVLPARNENIYGYGKQVARFAQLLHIASQLEHSSQTSNNTSSVATTGSGTLRKYLADLLSGQMVDHLVYDSNMGGVVSEDGLSDTSADFGNGRYNDHHFHYGYILYASAIMARLDPSFVAEFGSFVDAIFSDVANPMNGDSRAAIMGGSFFPQSRHKSWFDGHSFATGMFPFGNGKSQESSSEAVNCYYGAYLWALLRGGDASGDLANFASLLLAMEIRGAKTYWHMLPPAALGNGTSASSIYSPTFQENYMVGNLGMLDVTANTWFGNSPLYVHMINAIPITSATAALFDESYVQQEYNFLMKSTGKVEMAWRGYTVCIHAILDPNKAWQDAQELVSYQLDSAISKSQVLFWISSRHGFNTSIPITTSKTKSDMPSPSSSTISTTTTGTGEDGNNTSACSNNPMCDSQGLIGSCCPTLDGSFLDCCGAQARF